MLSRISTARLLVALGASLALLTLVACASAEEAQAPQQPVAPAAAATSVAGTAPAIMAPGQAQAPAAAEQAAPATGAQAPTGVVSAAPTTPPARVAPSTPSMDRPGFNLVTVAPFEVPPVPMGVELEAQQVMTITTNAGLANTGRPYVEGGGNRAWHWWTYMPLFLTGPFGRADELRQGVATSYEVSDDGFTYIIHLNPDAIFTDGSPVTAQDVKETWEYGAWPENQVSWGAVLLHTRGIKGIPDVESGETLEASGLTVLDDHTLQIELEEFNAVFPLTMTIWMLGIINAKEAKKVSLEEWTAAPIGIGPFATSYDADNDRGELVRTANWWGEPARLERVEVQTIRDNQTMAIIYENGETDLMNAASIITPQYFEPGHPFRAHMKRRHAAGIWYMAFVGDHPPFDELEVRAALAHGADFNNIVPAVFGSLENWARAIVIPGVPCHNAEWWSHGYEYDIPKAQAFMAASSYGSGENLPQILVELSRPQFIRTLEIAQESWKDNLGANVTVIRLEPGQQRTDVVEFRRQSIGSSVLDPSDIISSLGRDDSPTVASSANFKDPENLANIIAANNLRLDDPGRCAAYQKAELGILEDYRYMPILESSPFTWMMRPWVLNYQTTMEIYHHTLPYISIAKRDV